MKQEKSAYLYAILAALLWGSTAAVVKLLGINLNSLEILFYSSAIACLSLFFITLWQGKYRIIKTYRLKDYIRFSYMSFLGVFLYYALLYTALQRVPGQEAFIVNYTWPIWVIIFAIILLKESFTARKLLAIVLGFFGVFLVVSKGNIFGFDFTNFGGNILALLAAISYGLFSVLSKKHNDEKVTSTFFYYLFAFVCVGLFIFLFSSLSVPTLKEWLGLVWLGVFTSGLAFVLWLSALKYGDTGKMSNVIFLTPFLSLIYLFVLTGENILLFSIIGALLIFGGVIVQSYKGKAASRKKDIS